MSAAEEEAISALAADLYDAAVEPALWRPVLARVRDFVGGASAGVVAKDTATNRGFVCFDDGSITPDYTASYFDRYVGVDPCTTGHFFSSPDCPVATTDLIPHREFLDTRFYGEWAKPQGLIDYMGAAIDRTATTAVVFNVIRDESDGLFDGAARRRMRLIADHVRRAVTIGNAIEVRTAEATTFAEVIDGLNSGVFLIDGGGQIIHSNAAARAILGEGSGLSSARGELVARHPDTRRSLGAARAAARKGESAVGGGIAVPFAASDGEPYAAHVLPLTSGKRREAAARHGAIAALFVHKASAAVPSQAECIAQHFRLTATELRVLLAIVEIGGVPEVADALGIAASTVKTHLRNIYGKTDTARQADLVKLVSGFTGPLLN